ncbi:MAG: hypothetical protein EXS39_02415 [Opitutaceae bacterium]|nr:hypothetical protein [Opitutaceae bacterium]
MKLRKFIVALILISSFTVGSAFAGEAKKDAPPEGTKGKCCLKAEKGGKECAHGCCVEAAKAGKNCEKCGGTNVPEAKK